MICRQRIAVNGIVQGVGFRPFVYNLAHLNNLSGFVSNTSAGVIIELEGHSDSILNFIANLQESPPPLSHIQYVHYEEVPVSAQPGFEIRASRRLFSVNTQISPDVAVCDDCLKEIFDSGNRRFGYPFTNCTNCGPRYSIIRQLPYDRHLTTMESFTMCPQCREEYEDPSDRRFHAQPNACPRCGPNLKLIDDQGEQIPVDNEISEVIRFIMEGHIIAIKGLGGFHLAADATNFTAIEKLRQRKNREEKPFAIMVRDIQQAQNLCHLSPTDITWISSIYSPIVLLKRRTNIPVAGNAAPETDRLGLMLPYTPLHHLLLKSRPQVPPLIMTSANLGDEPICHRNEDAMVRLQGIADYFLLHNRSIHMRTDDSVLMTMNKKPVMIRRSRGFAPAPVLLKKSGPIVIAVGAELKNTICITKNKSAWISQHIGDLVNLESYEFFQKTIEHLQNVFDSRGDIFACDRHPGYLSTRWVKTLDPKHVVEVQHHHAHLASCMAEFSLTEPVIGLIMDGTGFGLDGNIWGGEVLVGDLSGFERKLHFQNMPLPGGDNAVKSPWRTAAAYLHQTYGGDIPDLPFLDLHDTDSLLQMVKKNFHCPRTSSCGRLFDAVAAMCGGRQTIHYEGQAAIEFMNLAVPWHGPSLEFEFNNGIISVECIIKSIVECIQKGENISVISGKFHQMLTALFTAVACLTSAETGIHTIVLSGGVFQNRLLLNSLSASLQQAGLSVFFNQKVPANDGGISLGQAMIARQKFIHL